MYYIVCGAELRPGIRSDLYELQMKGTVHQKLAESQEQGCRV